MIINFTQEELDALHALEDDYEKQIKDTEALIERLRPDDAEPSEDEYEQLAKQRPTPPPMPDPIEIKDNKPIYRSDDLEAYYGSSEYKAYAAENERINAAVDRLYREWYNNGSQEWKEARAKLERLESQKLEALNALFQRAEDRYFDSLGNSPTAILEDAHKQVRDYIFNRYNYYDSLKKEQSFTAIDVRVQDDGKFRLDTTETRGRILDSIRRHRAALSDELRAELDEYIDQALATSPFVSADGALSALVEQEKIAEIEPKQQGVTVIRPKLYKYPNTKVQKQLFSNGITTDDNKYFEPIGLNKKKTVVVYANFVMPKSVVSTLGLDDYDERVYAGIGSCLFAGNNFIPFTTLYNRGMLGLSPKEKNRAVTPDIENDILRTLEKCLGQITIDNDPQEIHKNDPNFKREIIRESLLFYQIREERVHGQITKGIAIPSGYVPILYRYAEQNREELITERIESINVSGLNYTRQNIMIMNATYKRVIEIRYHNDQKRYTREIPGNQRTIKYDTIAEKAGLDFSTMTPTERSRLKSKIDLCMQSYQKSQLFERYEHKKDGKSFYAVVLYFEPEPKKLK